MGVSDTNVLRFQDGSGRRFPCPSLSSGIWLPAGPPVEESGSGPIKRQGFTCSARRLHRGRSSRCPVQLRLGGPGIRQLFVLGDDVWLGGSDGAVRYDGERWIKYTSKTG